MAIQLLDAHTAELIAAGEVVERPASVVKELAENAIDAGATAVTVEIEHGGVSLIRVVDDGAGIEAADVELAFVRHATSKVRTQEDLEVIRTLGFRGEALASIASVARVELLSKNDADESAVLYTVSGGQPGEVREAARPRGTTITVRDLFYNTPARMKFLKKDASEGVFVTETVTRLALSHPEVALRYVREGRQVFATPGDGEARTAIYAVLGPDFARELLPVGYVDQQMRLLGFVTPPRAGRASRGMQFFFMNGRFVKNRTMMAALEQAYRGMMMQGKFPGGVLFLQMPPQLVDVNVHPAKTEVRFAKEQDVFGLVYRGVKAALLDNEDEHQKLVFPGVPQQADDAAALPDVGNAADAGVDSSMERSTEPPLAPVPFVPQPQAAGWGAQERPKAGQVRAYNAMVHQAAGEVMESPESAVAYRLNSTPPPPLGLHGLPGFGSPANERRPSPFFLQAIQYESEEPAPRQQQMEEETDELRLVGELFKTYIVAEWGDALCLIDKHAAHERLLYEEIAAARGQAAAQLLLSPVSVALSATEKTALLQNEESLHEVGIEVEDFGGSTVLVRGVPLEVDTADVEGLVVEVARRLSVNARDTLNQKTEWVMHSLACRAAVKGGQHTTPAEMLVLAQNILLGAVPPFCPHGRPVVLELTRKDLEKQFGRLG